MKDGVAFYAKRKKKKIHLALKKHQAALIVAAIYIHLDLARNN